jgi:hypothetical protein
MKRVKWERDRFEPLDILHCIGAIGDHAVYPYYVYVGKSSLMLGVLPYLPTIPLE